MQSNIFFLSIILMMLLTIQPSFSNSIFRKQKSQQKMKSSINSNNIEMLEKFNNQLNSIESLFSFLQQNINIRTTSFKQLNTSYVQQPQNQQVINVVNNIDQSNEEDDNYEDEISTNKNNQILYKVNQLSPEYQGPIGYQCKSQEECIQKNKQFYRQLKSQLIGQVGLNGEIGPTGDKGERGDRGKRGKRGPDGISPSKAYLEQVARQIVQSELQNLSKDQIISIEDYDADFLYQEIFYGSYENCHGPRLEFLKNCQNNEQSKCSNDQKQMQEQNNNNNYDNDEDEEQQFCCRSLKCLVSLDEMFCCMLQKKAAPHIIDEWDLNMDATWFDAIKEVEKRQKLAQQRGTFKKEHLLVKYQNLLKQCQKQNFAEDYQTQCDISKDFDNNIVFYQNQTASSSNNNNNIIQIN